MIYPFLLHYYCRNETLPTLELDTGGSFHGIGIKGGFLDQCSDSPELQKLHSHEFSCEKNLLKTQKNIDFASVSAVFAIHEPFTYEHNSSIPQHHASIEFTTAPSS